MMDIVHQRLTMPVLEALALYRPDQREPELRHRRQSLAQLYHIGRVAG
jgi:hypothetical protein